VRRTLSSQREITRERESSLIYSLDASREFLQSSPTWSSEVAAPVVAAAVLAASVVEEAAVTEVEEEEEAHLVEAMEEEEATAVEEEEGVLRAVVMEEEAAVMVVEEEEGEAHQVVDTAVEEVEAMEEVVMVVVEVEEEAAEIATIRGMVATEHLKILIEEAPTRAAQPMDPEMRTPAVGAAQGGRLTMTTTTTRHTSRSLSQLYSNSSLSFPINHTLPLYLPFLSR
jgi:hypothetical protein